MANRTISVLLATDVPILRDALRVIISDAQDLKFAGCIEAAPDILPAVRKGSPQLVILDASLAADSLPKLIEGIIAQNAKVLLIGGEADNDQMLQALSCGASGSIGRKATPDLICRSIRSVIAGELWVSRQITSKLIEVLRSGSAQAGALNQTAARILSRGHAHGDHHGGSSEKYGLTKRELQIVGALVEGQTNKDIAATFGVSEYTVKHHLTNIFDKLGVYNRVELVLFALTNNLCAPAEETTAPSGRTESSRKR